MARDDGGPAFGHGSPEHGGDPGMSLRDYFAGQALTGLIANHMYSGLVAKAGGVEEALEATANVAYAHADAMLSARGGTE